MKGRFDTNEIFVSIKDQLKTLIELLEKIVSSWYPVDWRELIYQMAKDYYAFNSLDNFELKIR
jgi:hypothetical protein